jgi:pentalenene oxygenase
LDEIITAVVARYRHEGAPRPDLLTAILEAHDEDTGRHLTDSEVHDQVRTILTAGTETTASLLSWTFWLLSQHPRVLADLHAELDTELDGRTAEFEDVARLDYAKRVLTEALRLYPPGWLLSRMTTEAVTLHGFSLAAGAEVLFSPYLLHRDPDVFPDPERFDPDRWLPGRVTAAQREAFTAMGGGRRKCIGDVFGMTEAVIVLATVAGRWDLQLSPGARVQPALRIVLNPSALRMTASPRRPEKTLRHGDSGRLPSLGTIQSRSVF